MTQLNFNAAQYPIPQDEPQAPQNAKPWEQYGVTLEPQPYHNPEPEHAAPLDGNNQYHSGGLSEALRLGAELPPYDQARMVAEEIKAETQAITGNTELPFSTRNEVYKVHCAERLQRIAAVEALYHKTRQELQLLEARRMQLKSIIVAYKAVRVPLQPRKQEG